MSENESPFGFETLAIHAGGGPDPATGARSTPIYQTTAYVFDDADHAASLFNLQTYGFIYSRLTNPTVSVLEERVAALEGGKGGTATASGHAAQMLALFPLMQPGAHLLASNKLYGGSVTQFTRTFAKFGWQASLIDFDDLDTVRAAIRPETRVLFCESLANPGGIVSDMEALAAIAHEAGIPLMVDNTMATPFLCRPFEWGADLIVHSMTKFLSGHGNAMGGMVVDSGGFDWGQNDKFPSMTEPEGAYHGLRFWETFGDLGYTVHCHAVGLRDLGATMAPLNAFLTITGIETLPLRMARHGENGLEVARYLAGHPAVAWVSYAGLEDNPYNRFSRGRAGALTARGQVSGRLGRLGVHLRPEGRLRSGREAGGRRRTAEPSRQSRRHALAHHPSPLHHPPPALRGTGRSGRRRRRGGAALRRPRNRSRHRRRPGAGAGLTGFRGAGPGRSMQDSAFRCAPLPLGGRGWGWASRRDGPLPGFAPAASPASGRGGFPPHKAADRGRGGGTGPPRGCRLFEPATCHEMSCFVMRPAGTVMFCHGPPRLRLDRRPSVSRMPFLHRVSFHPVPFLPPPAPPCGGSLFRAYRVPACVGAGAGGCAHFAPARISRA